MKKTFLLLFGFLLSTPKVLAAEWTLIPNTGDLAKAFRTGIFTTDLIIKYGLHLIGVLIEVAGVVAVILVMIGGYRYVIAPEKNEEAKKNIIYALMGFALCVLSWLMVNIVIAFLTTE